MYSEKVKFFSGKRIGGNKKSFYSFMPSALSLCGRVPFILCHTATENSSVIRFPKNHKVSWHFIKGTRADHHAWDILLTGTFTDLSYAKVHGIFFLNFCSFGNLRRGKLMKRGFYALKLKKLYWEMGVSKSWDGAFRRALKYPQTYPNFKVLKYCSSQG